MKQTQIIILGEDPRQRYLYQELISQGFWAYYHPHGDLESISSLKDIDCVVFPIFPSSRMLLQSIEHCKSQALLCAGLPSKEFLQTANDHNFSVYDYMSDKEVAQLNAVATAEGAIAEGLRLSKVNLQGSHCLIIGYGRCGEILAQKCQVLGANVTVCDYDSSKTAHAQAHGHKVIAKLSDLNMYSYIFNTAPAPVLTTNLLDTVSECSIIIDLASSPGGTDFDACLKKKISAKLCPSLPAIYAPKTSGIILAQAITKRLRKV